MTAAALPKRAGESEGGAAGGTLKAAGIPLQLFALIWSRPDVVGLFPNNVVSFSRNVVLSGPLFWARRYSSARAFCSHLRTNPYAYPTRSFHSAGVSLAAWAHSVMRSRQPTTSFSQLTEC